MLAASHGNWPVNEDNVSSAVIKSWDVTAMMTEEIGSITFNWGSRLTLPQQGHTTNYGLWETLVSFNRSCNALMALNRYTVCLTSSQLIIIPDQLWNSAGEQVMACHDCNDMAFDGLNIWAISPSNNQVYKIDLTREYSASVSTVGIEPCGSSWCHPNPKDPTIVGTINVGTNPQGVEFDGERVWVTNQDSDTVTVIKTSDSSLVATLSVGDAPTEVLFDGQSVWVLNSADETVTQIDASTRSVVGTYGVGSSPKAMSFDGSAIWVANSGDDNVTLLRHTDGSLVETISLSGSPQLLQFDGEGTWVATKDNLPDIDMPGVRLTGVRWVLTRY